MKTSFTEKYIANCPSSDIKAIFTFLLINRHYIMKYEKKCL